MWSRRGTRGPAPPSTDTALSAPSRGGFDVDLGSVLKASQAISGEIVLARLLVGSLDRARAAEIMQSLLERIVSTGSAYALIDLTGVDSVDSATADHLLRIVRGLKLLGAQAIITGIHGAVAQTVVSLDLDMSGITTRESLRDRLQLCMVPRRHAR